MLGRQLQHRRRGIDQHAEPRAGDRLGTHLPRIVHGANSKPVFAFATPMKQEMLLGGRRFRVELPTPAAIHRNEELDFHGLPGRIVGLIDAEGNGEVRLPSNDRSGGSAVVWSAAVWPSIARPRSNRESGSNHMGGPLAGGRHAGGAYGH